jgi:aminomethyltransferase
MNRTPFFADHQSRGARLIDFGGWEMPVQFAGILQEHAAVRERAGVFDISHMGQVWVTGKDALEFLQKLLSNDLSKITPGKGQYNLMCRDDGGVIDDLYVYFLAPERYLVIINASHIPVDLQWMRDHKVGNVSIEEQPNRAAIALQGPAAEKIISSFVPEVTALKRNGVGEFTLLGQKIVIARTGYTGEDGFEFFGPAAPLLEFYPKLIEAGKPFGLEPIGLGARDTLRLEMGYRLHGNDLDEQHTALEAGLNWAIKLDKKEDFSGKASLVREQQRGSKRKFIAFRVTGAGVARHGYPILAGGTPIGEVTSGTFSPSLKAGIGAGFVDARAFAAAQDKQSPLSVKIHTRDVSIELAQLPFYKKEVLAASK